MNLKTYLTYCTFEKINFNRSNTVLRPLLLTPDFS
jgi:hypothetical protein